MTVDDAPGRVTICRRGRSVIFADDAGVTVRSFPGRPRQYAWSEISHFADGIHVAPQGLDSWVLDIALRTGRTFSVPFTRATLTAVPTTLAAVRQVAERYGIPADLHGVMTKDGLPPSNGLYKDPGGQDGLRYWDGSRWSPLLSAGGPQWGTVVHQSTASWTALPVAPKPWTYPAIKAARAKVWIPVFASLTAALLAAAPVVGLISGNWLAAGAFFTLAFCVAILLLGSWLNWLHWHQLQARAEPPSPSELAVARYRVN